MADIGPEVSPDEVRWLLTNRIDGPTLLMLNDNFQRFRASQRPAFYVLDRDRDSVVSAQEIQLAVESFKECDLNRDDIVSYAEIGEVANDPRLKQTQHAGFGKLIFEVPDSAADTTSSLTDLYRRLAACYARPGSDQPADQPVSHIVPRFDTNANGRFEPAELHALQQDSPDISLQVAFNTAAPDQATITIVAVAPRFKAAVSDSTIDEHSLTLPLAGTLVRFSALQGDPGDQVAVGAVDDGYPLLPAIDPNHDGRFTIRELRQLVDRLNQHDLNQDGSLTATELRSTVRLCFALGPHVHQELARLRDTYNQSYASAVAGPEWFVRMDRNKDNDLTRSEFPGTDEQYASLDADNDQLISAQEALNFEQNQ
jgi:Ca2+-binding EF-hand superfamily protein